MKEFTTKQIAAELHGHPGSAEQELRLLRLFQSDAGAPTAVEVDVKRELTPEPVRKAA